MASGILALSSDVNGTLVYERTMEDMVRDHRGRYAHTLVAAAFARDDGHERSPNALEVAAELTKGMSLRKAIDHAISAPRYVNGIHDFIDGLRAEGTALILNSTGYTVTLEAIRAMLGADVVHGCIGNHLRFAMRGDQAEELTAQELAAYAYRFVADADARRDSIYEQVQATGTIDVRVTERTKPLLLSQYLAASFPHIRPQQVGHMGDTAGDLAAIEHVAGQGGLGIAFNYDDSLRQPLAMLLSSQALRGKVYFADPKGLEADLRHVLPALR